MSTWTEFEPVLRAYMNAAIEAQPESLLEQDGGPVGATADIILARLVGFDDQVIDDTLRLDRVRAEWFMPIAVSLRVLVSETAPLYAPIRAARYVLQSGWARVQIDPGLGVLPPDTKTGPDHLVSVLFVRYRRRI